MNGMAVAGRSVIAPSGDSRLETPMSVHGADVAPVPVKPETAKPGKRGPGRAPRSKFGREQERLGWLLVLPSVLVVVLVAIYPLRSEEHTSELQSLMRIS